MHIKLLTNAEFLQFTKVFKPSSIYQTPYYAFTMNEENYTSMFVGLMDGNVLKAASLILVYKVNGFKYALAPRGFLIDYNDENLVTTFTKLIKKYLGKKDIVAIKINPMIIKKVYNSKGYVITDNQLYETTFNRLKKLGYFHLGYNNYFEALKPRFEAYINLDMNYIKLFGNIDKSCRNKIRKAVRDGIKVYHGDINDLKYLYEQTQTTYPRGLQYFIDLYKFFGKDNLIDFYYSKLDTTDYLQYTQSKYNEYSKKSSELNHKLISQKGNSEKIINEFKYENEKVISCYFIKETVAKYFSISKDDLSGNKRSNDIAFPRQIAMYLCREVANMSYPQIGIDFGGRDHSTVMHACKKIEKEVKEKNNTKLIVDSVKNIIIKGKQ